MQRKASEEELEQLIKIGKGLRKLRKERNYSNYHKLAYDMDMTHSQYGGYEKGKNMNVLTLIRILNFHEISIQDFLKDYVSEG